MYTDQHGRPAVTPEIHAELMVNPEARAARLAELLGGLSAPTEPLRGKSREPSFSGEVPMPAEIPQDLINDLGQKLAERPEPITDDITEYPSPRPVHDWGAIRVYVEYAGIKNARKKRLAEEAARLAAQSEAGLEASETAEVDKAQEPEEEIQQTPLTEEELIAKEQLAMALERKPENIYDRVQWVWRVAMQLAQIRRAALHSVQHSVRYDQSFDPVAARWAAEAIEEFGLSLRQSHIDKSRQARPDKELRINKAIEEVQGGADLPYMFEVLGAYAVEHPDILRRQPDVLRLVQIEQAKREDWWGGYYQVMLLNDKDRSTADDREATELVQQMIARFNTRGEASAQQAS